ncbi:MAG TPA: hypothetical protein VG713_07580 [Pirellulales bacterium]|nr:hypothetical protein [Pirellulales bacterium]
MNQTKEIAKGIHLIPTISEVKGSSEMAELSLAIATPEGLVVITGCGHCGIEKVLEAASTLDRRIRLLAGGFHLVNHSEAEIERIGASLRNHWNVQAVAPGHCTSEQGFLTLLRLFDRRYLYAGVGEVLPLP